MIGRTLTHRFALCIAAGLLFAIAADGPDFGHYVDWAAAALTGDIFALRGNVLSPGGVPFSLASAGPGMLFAAARVFLLDLVSIGTAAYVAGWAAAIVFWVSALAVLRRMAGGDRTLMLFGAGALFIGTHAGFYSRSYATEIFANALVAAAWALGLSRERWRLIDCAAAGAVAGLLLVVRPYLLLYAVPMLWLAAFAGRRPLGSKSDAAPVAGPAARLIAITVPLALAAAQYAVVNHWMTGSALHPPYVYGSAGFTSVDLWHPQFAAVLMHPWHGLLAYHPLYAVAFAAVAMEMWRSPGDRWLWGATLAACLAHLWVQSAWYIWWLGANTFGMRGMAPAALPLVAGLVATIRRGLDRDSRDATIWMRVTMIACAWSLPLLWQATQVATWAQLVASERWVPPLVAALIAAWIWQRATQRRSATSAAHRGSRLDASLLSGATLAYLLSQLLILPDAGVRSVRALAASAVVAIGLWLVRVATGRAAAATKDAPSVVAIATIVVFAAQAVLFARLALVTERHLAAGVAPPRGFEYAGSSPVDELRVTYAEYRQVPGFEPQKAAFRRFLIRQRLDASAMAPADRHLAERVAAAFAADPVLRRILVEPDVRDGVVTLVSTEMDPDDRRRAHAVVAGVAGVAGVRDDTR